MSRLDSIAFRRLLFWSLPTALLAAVLVVAFRAEPEQVDIAVVMHGPMTVSLDEEGETRVHDVFTVSAPLSGRLLRTPLHVGDRVTAGETVVACIEPADPSLLDPRARAEAEAAVRAAEAAARYARAERERAAAEEEFASAEVKRMRELHGRGVVSRQAIDEAERAHRTASAAMKASEEAIRIQDHELARARAALLSPAEDPVDTGTCLDLHSPVDGQVLAIREKSETVVPSGMPLLDVGDPAELEIVADYLSTEAVSLQPGQRAIIDGWGGAPLNAVVRRVEPSAFTKVSALGIEEQRVNVILDLVDPRQTWQALGHGYRVEVRVIVWEAEAVDIVPLTALFREDDGWAVFTNEGGVARRRSVAVGHRSGLEVEVREGLTPGEQVIVDPSERIEDGTRIRGRRP